MNSDIRRVDSGARDGPPVDLTEHRVVHRGIRVDLGRLAAVAVAGSTTTQRPGPRRIAFADYLTSLAATTVSHLRVDSYCLIPLLARLTGAPQSEPGADVARLTELLAAASAIAVRDHPGSSRDAADLPRLLDDAARIAEAIVRHHERTAFPLIRAHLPADDHRWVREQYRRDLPPGLLAFVVPWTIRHARPEELPSLHDPTLDVAHRIFVRRFHDLESRVFGGSAEPAPRAGRRPRR